MRGSVVKRGERRYSIVWRAPDPATGKVRQMWRSGFSTRAAAEQTLKDTVSAIDAGTYVPPTKSTLGQFVRDKWLPSIEAEVVGGSLKPTTAAFYRNLVTAHVIPKIGGIPLARLDAPRLNAFYGELLREGRTDGKGGLSRTTVHSIHVVISRALSDAVRWNLVARNVAKAAKPPTPTRTEMAVWGAEELRTFLLSVADDRLVALWHLAATTGLRRGELCGLRWRDLDLAARRLSVTGTRVTVGYRVADSTPKTAKSSRTIGLDSDTAELLRFHHRRQLAEAGEFPGWSNATGLVFVREDGTPYHPQRITGMFEAAAKRAGLPAIRLHDLRHSYATAALEAGVSLKVVSERLGHSNLAITADLYTHVREQVDQDAADRTAAFIRGVG
jgi:integrase